MLDGGRILSHADLKEMHRWPLTCPAELGNLNSWVRFLENYKVFYSNPLDLDFLMLTHYPEFYKNAIPKNGGPRVPDKIIEPTAFAEKVKSSLQATLKSENATAITYTNEDKELMIWYNYHFLGRGKPATHIEVLSSMSDEQLNDKIPEIFKKIFKEISLTLNIES